MSESAALLVAEVFPQRLIRGRLPIQFLNQAANTLDLDSGGWGRSAHSRESAATTDLLVGL